MIRVLPLIDRRTLIAGGAALLALSPARAEAPATIRRLSPALDRILAPDARVETVARDIRWAEGPVWSPRDGGFLLFSDPPANIVRRWDARGGVRVFLDPSGAAGTDPAKVREPGANGLVLDRQGHLLIANSGGRSVERMDLATCRRTIVADRYRGKRFNSPNDLAVAADGTIWFTDPPYGLVDGERSPLRELPHNGVYRVRPGGAAELMVADLSFPNGIGLSPDGRRLYVSVSDPAAQRIMAYDLDAKGDVRGGRVWLDAAPLAINGAPGLPDGMKVARDGTMFCSVPGGLMILTPEAEPLGLIATGTGPIANCCFGEGGRTLFLAADHQVLRVPLARAMT